MPHQTEKSVAGLVTVIGIKYASNSPCDPKKGPKFKVESYVPEEYLKLVEFAAL
jgi:hypothetical protein